MDAASCLKKQQEIEALFEKCTSFEEKYQLLIDMGKEIPPLAPHDKIEGNRVYGCQSLMYVKASFLEGRCFFQTDADALISQGMGALLTRVYSGETPEVVLSCPPAFLEKIGLTNNLSPSRINGLASLFAHMKKQALLFLLSQGN